MRQQIQDQLDQQKAITKMKRRKEWVQKKKDREMDEEKEIQEILQKSNVMESMENMKQLEAEHIDIENLLEQNGELKRTLMSITQELEGMQSSQPHEKKVIESKELDSQYIYIYVCKVRKMELKLMRKEIAKYEWHVNGLQREFQNNFDINRMLSKEDELSLLKAEHQALLESKENILGNFKQNTKQNELLRKQQSYNLKNKGLEQNLEEAKQAMQSNQSEVYELEQELHKFHQNTTYKEQRILEMQERVREKEMYADKVFYVSEEEICVIEERLSELQKQDAELEILFRNKMTNLEIERQQRQQEADDKLRAEKELRKELNMNKYKFNQLARLIRHNVLPPIDNELKKSLYI